MSFAAERTGRPAPTDQQCEMLNKVGAGFVRFLEGGGHCGIGDPEEFDLVAAAFMETVTPMEVDSVFGYFEDPEQLQDYLWDVAEAHGML